MEPEFAASNPWNPSQLSWVNLYKKLILVYQTFGVVYGDLSTSPLYVFQNTLFMELHEHETEDAIFGTFSVIFWTLTLIPLLKYVFIVLTADDNGEGGAFALYSLLCRHAKFSLLPNQQAADEEVTAYRYGHSALAAGRGASSPLKRFLEKHKRLRRALLIVVLFGAAMVIGDGVLTPAISVLSLTSGLHVADMKLTNGELLLIACVILVGLFALQHFGTHRVGFMFAPIGLIWLISIFTIGLYNIVRWNPKAIRAISPYYVIKFFSCTGKDGWIALGGILLSVTGTETMFADIGHFTALSVRLAFAFVIYPCLIAQYMGQAAFLSKNPQSIRLGFYESVPEPVFWPVFVISILAAIVGSQAVITATFSIIKQCEALGCFPRVKIVHTSQHIFGQIYIPEINWILMFLTLAITIGFQDITVIGNAYGLACMTVMVITTFLMSLVMIFVWQKSVLVALIFLVFFWSIEGIYLSAALIKVPQGGWVPLVLSIFIMLVMYVWHYGVERKYSCDLQNKVPLKWLLGLGPSLGMVRVPGIGLIYSELATGIPPIFSHFVTNLPAFHKVLVFVCVKSIPVPYVPPEERILVGRVCPRPYGMYRCIVRYGYKDNQQEDGDFENQLIQSIAEFIRMEAGEQQSLCSESSTYDGRMAVISTLTFESVSTPLTVTYEAAKDFDFNNSIDGDEEIPVARRHQGRLQVRDSPDMDPSVREELMELIRAKESGVAYLMGHSYVQARRSSSIFKKLAINFGYTFLRKNCRGPDVVLNIPHINLIEVGMIYYI